MDKRPSTHRIPRWMVVVSLFLVLSLSGPLLLVGIVSGLGVTPVSADQPRPNGATGSGDQTVADSFVFLPLILKNHPPVSAATNTPTPTSSAASNEMLVLDWNGPVTKPTHGMGLEIPPAAAVNGDWTSPAAFSEGSLYYRVEIRSQPQPQDMYLQYCVWQQNRTIENCGAPKAVMGMGGTIAFWSGRVQAMSMVGGQPVDWSKARQEHGVVIKNDAGLPVSDLNGWNWNGENPDEWYPLDMRFTVVVVAKGATFSGWDHWLSATPTATSTATPTGSPTATGSVTATPTSESTATETPTPTPTPSSELADELLVFDWNRPVTKDDHGFPMNEPPLPSANGDWTAPANFAEGTLYFRAEIRSQPVTQQMRLQFCFWQNGGSLQNCSLPRSVPGASGTIVTWTGSVKDLWKLSGLSMNWANARDKNGVVIKNSSGGLVSDLEDWNWSGENPDDWYPLDMRFSVVVVAKGGTFSGWNYWTKPRELLVLDWNQPVTKEGNGLGYEEPVNTAANGDWTTPGSFSTGTLYYRVQIRSQPVAQTNRIQYCVEQTTPTTTMNCGPLKNVTGSPGKVVTWSGSMSTLWKQGNVTIDWTKPRDRHGAVIKNLAGAAVTDLYGLNWSGEDPDAWYPLDLRFMVVAVAEGETFSGWAYWLGQPTGPTPTPTVTNTPGPSPTPTDTPTATATPTVTNTPDPNATPTDTPTATSTPTPTPTGSPQQGQELLVYDWNQPALKSNHGFPLNIPPLASGNGNWVSPVNFRQGTLYFRAEIRSQPVAQDMRLQFCFWQSTAAGSYDREECALMKQVWGTPGNVVTWSATSQQVSVIDPIDWTKPRYAVSSVVKNKLGKPVTDFPPWDWSGEDPNLWYPLDMRFTVVVVAPGATFSGWGTWIEP